MHLAARSNEFRKKSGVVAHIGADVENNVPGANRGEEDGLLWAAAAKSTQ